MTVEQRARQPEEVVALALQNPGRPVELVSPLEYMAAVGWALTTNTTFVHGRANDGTPVIVAWESDEAREKDLKAERT